LVGALSGNLLRRANEGKGGKGEKDITRNGPKDSGRKTLRQHRREKKKKKSGKRKKKKQKEDCRSCCGKLKA